jgi:hypothetical protein
VIRPLVVGLSAGRLVLGRDEGDGFDFDVDRRPHQRVDDREHERGLVLDHLFPYAHVGLDVLGPGQVLADADDVTYRGSGRLEDGLEVPPGLPGFLGEIGRDDAIDVEPGVPETMIWSWPRPAGIRMASE